MIILITSYDDIMLCCGNRILYAALSPAGNNLITGAGDETLKLWHLCPPRSPPSYSTTIDRIYVAMKRKRSSNSSSNSSTLFPTTCDIR